MVVCICNALRERDVREAARHGARSPAKAYSALGCKAQCGQCIPFARTIIKAEQAIAC